MRRATFATTIRTARRKQELTQEAVAKAAGCSAPMVCMAEAGTTVPRAAIVVAIARHLGLDPLKTLRVARPKDYTAWRGAFIPSGSRVLSDKQLAALCDVASVASQIAAAYRVYGGVEIRRALETLAPIIEDCP